MARAEDITIGLPKSGKKRKAKKEKNSAKKARAVGDAYFAVHGEEARAEIELKSTQIKLKDVQDLLSWVHGDGPNPKWVFLKNKALITKVVVLFANCLDATTFAAHASVTPFLSSLCNIACSVQAPGSSTRVFPGLQSLLLCPKKTPKKAAAMENDAQAEVFPGPDHYVLSASELDDNGYPNASDEDVQQEYVTTTARGDSNGSPTVLGVDCEMCMTTEGLELTRISVVAMDGSVLYDKFVLPENDIVDYLTHYSGVTADHLKGAISLREVQQWLLENVDSSTILLGHSLENDLRALKLVHRRIIDTALLYPHPRGPPHKSALRWLVRQHLSRKIQNNGADGHDSIQDSLACIDLLKMKLTHGPSFGELDANSESLFTALHRHNVRCSMFDLPAHLRAHATASVRAVPCQDNTQLTEALVREVSSVDRVQPSLVVAQLHSLADYFRGSSPGRGALRVALAELDDSVRTVHAACAPGTLLLVLSGTGDLCSIDSMLARKNRAANSQMSVGWQDGDETDLRRRVVQARDALGFFCIT